MHLPADHAERAYREKIARDPEFTRFFTKAGWLTPYALSCGYIERRSPAAGGSVMLRRACPAAEPGIYEVLWETGPVDGWFSERFSNINDARAYFSAKTPASKEKPLV